MTIVEPVSNGLGSDAFCILWDGKELHGLNASGRAPQGWAPEYFHQRYGRQDKPPRRGVDSITVPGAVSACGLRDIAAPLSPSSSADPRR